MKRLILLFVCINAGLQVHAQQTLQLSRQEAEALFLQNNLLLISEKLRIESQRAEVIQAKMWPNPEFSIGELNLWKNATVEPSPPFVGSFGRNQQIAFELNQLIQTAGKRGKLIALEQVDVAKAEQYFEELLRGLKRELRDQLTELQYVQQMANVHQNLIESIAVLTQAYRNQASDGHISQAEYIRIKAQELEISKEILNLSRQSNEVQKELKLLLGVNPSVRIEILDDLVIPNPEWYRSVLPGQMAERAKGHRPDYKLALLEEDYAHKLLAYEKAQRVPDLKLGVNYDRNGSTMLNFVGLGVSFDLPLFNRNKGRLQQAQIGIQNAEVQKEQTAMTIENEIFAAYQSLQRAIDFLHAIEENYEAELDILLENYTRNFAARNVSMLAYFDFMDAYLNNKKIILEAKKDARQKAEELIYSLGEDL